MLYILIDKVPVWPAKSSTRSALKVVGFSKLGPTLHLGFRKKGKALIFVGFQGSSWARLPHQRAGLIALWLTHLTTLKINK